MVQLQNCVDIAITTFMIRYEVNLLFNVEATLVQCCEFDIVELMWWRHSEFDIAISGLSIQHFHNIFSIFPMQHFQSNLLSNIEATFNFEGLASTSLQRYVLTVRRWNFTTTLCVCWDITLKVILETFNYLNIVSKGYCFRMKNSVSMKSITQ